MELGNIAKLQCQHIAKAFPQNELKKQFKEPGYNEKRQLNTFGMYMLNISLQIGMEDVDIQFIFTSTLSKL